MAFYKGCLNTISIGIKIDQLWPKHHQQQDQHQHQRLELWKGICETNAQTLVIMQSKIDDMWLLCSLQWVAFEICHFLRLFHQCKRWMRWTWARDIRVSQKMLAKISHVKKRFASLKSEIDDQYQIYEISLLRLLLLLALYFNVYSPNRENRS